MTKSIFVNTTLLRRHDIVVHDPLYYMKKVNNLRC